VFELAVYLVGMGSKEEWERGWWLTCPLASRRRHFCYRCGGRFELASGVWVVSVPRWAQRVGGSHWYGRLSCWGLVFVDVFVVRLLSVDVAERTAVGANEVYEGFAGFLAVDVADGLGHLSWVVSGVMSWQEGRFTHRGPSFHSS